jgi:hypothetical protein
MRPARGLVAKAIDKSSKILKGGGSSILFSDAEVRGESQAIVALKRSDQSPSSTLNVQIDPHRESNKILHSNSLLQNDKKYRFQIEYCRLSLRNHLLNRGMF